MQTKNSLNYYRILPSPLNSPHKNKKHSQLNKSQSPQKLTESIIRNNHYVYIDINEQSESGIKEMQKISAEELDLQSERIGRSFIGSLNNLSMQSQKVIDYIYKLQDMRKQKERFKVLLKKKLDATIAYNNSYNNRTKGKSRIPKSVMKMPVSQCDSPEPLIYRGMQAHKLKQYLQKKQLESIHQIILQKQKSLIEKYGFTNEYESITKQKSPIVRNKRSSRIFLPEVRSVPNISYD